MCDKISCLRTYFHNFWRCYTVDGYGADHRALEEAEADYRARREEAKEWKRERDEVNR